MRAIQKVISGELRAKQAMKICIIYKKKSAYFSYFSMWSATCELRLVWTPSINSLLFKHCEPHDYFRYVNRW
jgi:hypothetical protein